MSIQELKRYEAKKGDVFFTRTSETPDEVGLSSVLLEEIGSCSFSGFVLRGRPKNDWLDLNYCKYCFSTDVVRRAIVDNCTYTTRALTNGKQLSTIDIPLPPKDEQTAIATALSDTDALIDSLEKLIVKKQAIKQGTMQEFLTGKRRLKGFSGEWKNIKIGDLGVIETTSIDPQQNKKKYFMEYSMPAYDFGKMPQMTLGQNMSSQRYVISAPTLLFNKLNVRKKRIWFIDSETDNAVCSTEFLPYKSSKINLCLLRELLLQDDVVSEFEDMSTGTSNSQKRITPHDFLAYRICIPIDIQEQQAIAQILTDMDDEISTLQKKLDKVRRIKQGMMAELLTGRIRLI